MELDGTIHNGVVVLDEPGDVPEGTRVKVVVPIEADVPKQSLRDLLLGMAGAVDDLPPDMAINHDHYLCRTPKK